MKKVFKSSGSLQYWPAKILGLLLIIATVTSSCKNNNDDVEPQQVSALNFINASPGTQTFNFYLDNQLVNGPALAYAQKTDYLLAFSGSRKFDIALTGTNQSLATATLQLETDKYYTLFISGPNSTLGTLLVKDELTTPAAGKSNIRFVQLSPGAGNLTLNVKGGSTLVASQAFNTASPFQALDANTYVLEVKNASGTTLDEETLTFATGKIYTIWAGGLNDSGETATEIQVSGNN